MSVITQSNSRTDTYRMTIRGEAVTVEQVYPCHCGITHEGPYAIYAFGHHNCDHESPLIALDPTYLICPLCGYTFTLGEK